MLTLLQTVELPSGELELIPVEIDLAKSPSLAGLTPDERVVFRAVISHSVPLATRTVSADAYAAGANKRHRPSPARTAGRRRHRPG
jgi:hypothetical protein